jgi:hypothetical protein
VSKEKLTAAGVCQLGARQQSARARAQGREADVVIFSCVRARGAGARIGFLADIRRMNVAITRARCARARALALRARMLQTRLAGFTRRPRCRLGRSRATWLRRTLAALCGAGAVRRAGLHLRSTVVAVCRLYHAVLSLLAADARMENFREVVQRAAAARTDMSETCSVCNAP